MAYQGKHLPKKDKKVKDTPDEKTDAESAENKTAEEEK